MSKKKRPPSSPPKKTYFGSISDGRGSAPEEVSPFDVIIAGLDTEASERLAAQGEEEAQAVDDATIEASNRELRPLLEDPAKFLQSHAHEARRLYNLHSIESILTTGGLLVNPVARAVGDGFLVEVGRHRTAWMRIVLLLLEGKLHIPLLIGLVTLTRQEKGADWRPAFFVQKPPSGSQTTVNIDVENSLRLVATDEDKFELVMKRIAAAERNEATPDYASIARNLNVESANLVKSWQRLSTMHKKVQRYVLVGTGPSLQGPRVPLGAAMEVHRRTKDKNEQLALIEAMIAAGDTRVATAKATTKHSSGGASGGAPVVVRPGWSKAEFLKFYDAVENPPLVVQALAKLLRDGPDTLTPSMRRTLPGLDEYLTPKYETS